MKKKLLLAVSVLAIFFGATAIAHADPIGKIGLYVAKAAVDLFFAMTTLGITLMALFGEKPGPPGGVKASSSAGGTTPQTFVMGLYATSGHFAAPMDTFGAEKKTPNAYLVYVVELGAIPGQTLERLIIADNYVPFTETMDDIGSTGFQGWPVGGEYEGNAWIRYHDGNQTAADELLVNALTDDGTRLRPWDTDMIGKGIPYAVLVFRYNSEVFTGPPSVRFEVGGIPLYDPRLDDTVGGTGPHRWGQPETYADNQSTNLVVMIYNIHRGITLPDGLIWGGVAQAEDLPLDNWFDAMNECDVGIDIEGGTEPQYSGGIEISVDQEPIDVMNKLMAACCAQQVNIGGTWKIRVGPPAMPVFFFTDDDILISEDQEEDSFPGLDDVQNAIHATHPLPDALWEDVDAPPRYDDGYEAEDDGQRLVTTLRLDPVFSPTQAQRIMVALLKDNRRFVTHSMTLGPYASMLEPLDCVTWTSTKKSYTAKAFEINQTIETIRSINITVAMRERDQEDFDPDIEILPWPIPVLGSALPVAQDVPDFEVEAGVMKDTAGNDRKPTIIMTWDGSEMPDVDGLQYEIRLASTLADVKAGETADIARDGLIVADGILPDTDYQVRAKLIVNRRANWTSWINVTTLDVRLSFDDLADPLVSAIETPLEEILKTNLQLQSFRQIQEGLNYTGDGKSLQFVSLQALNQSQTALDRIDLIGVLAPDASAYVLNTDFVKIEVPKDGGGTEVISMAGFIDVTYASLGEAESFIQQQGEVNAGLYARYTLKVQNVTGTGQVAIAGMVFNADDETSTIGFFAENFFIADNSGSSIKYPFVYTGGQLYLNTDVSVNGNLVVNGTVTTQKLIINGVSEEANDIRYNINNVSTEKTGAQVTVSYPPEGSRVRLQYRILADNPSSEEIALRVKLYKNDVLLGSIRGTKLNLNFSTTYVDWYTDFDPNGVSTDPIICVYRMTVQTVTGADIGESGGTGINRNIFEAEMTAEVMKR